VVTHKLSRKDLKKDSFAALIGKSIDFIQENYMRLAVALLVLVVVVFGVIFYFQGQRRGREQASYLLYQGQNMLAQGAYGAAEVKLKECMDRYGGTFFGKMARLDLAQAMLARGEYQESLSVLQQAEQASPGGQSQRKKLLSMRAAALVGLQRFQEAAALYRELLSGSLTDSERYELSFQLADCLQASGQVQAAFEVLAELEEDFLRGDISQPNRDLQLRLELLRNLAQQ
jgi:predicted negative regulator of RcsB-dependent stress response